MNEFERTIAAINDLYLEGDFATAERRSASIFNNPKSDYDLVVSALALMRNHGAEEQWAKWAGILNERDWGVPTELTPTPYPFGDAPFDGQARTFKRLGTLLRGGQAGTSLALNPIKEVTLDDAGIQIKRRFGGESIAWSEITAGALKRERTDSMADLVGLPGFRQTLVLERASGEPLELDVSTCIREFDFPLQLLAAVSSRVSVVPAGSEDAAPHPAS